GRARHASGGEAVLLREGLDLGASEGGRPRAHLPEDGLRVSRLEAGSKRSDARILRQPRRPDRLAESAKLRVGDGRERDEAVAAADDVGGAERAVAVPGGTPV